ncbi:hypothetical protein ACIBEK_08275 [Nocardia fusca]|uniref:hypothetical protein n=1 Tax=Nocardia fusca TaxID=941183 RepID=UPI0037A9CC46
MMRPQADGTTSRHRHAPEDPDELTRLPRVRLFEGIDDDRPVEAMHVHLTEAHAHLTYDGGRIRILAY